MNNQTRCMSIKKARLIVNAHKHHLLNSFCNNGYVTMFILNNMKTTTKINAVCRDLNICPFLLNAA